MELEGKNIPELFGECWLPRDAARCCPGGDGPLRGLPGGNVSVIDIRLAIGLCVCIDAGGVDVSPIETGGIGSGIDVG